MRYVTETLFPALSHLDSAVLATRLESQDTKGGGNDHTLLTVVWWRNTLEKLEALESSGTTGGLVGDHPTDGLEENLRWCTVVEGTRFPRVDDMALVEKIVIAQLCKKSMLTNCVCVI